MYDLTQSPGPAFLAALESNLRRMATTAKVNSHFLQALELRFEADAAWLWLWPSRLLRGTAAKVTSGDASLIDEELTEAFAANRRPRLPNNLLLAPLVVKRRRVGLLGVARGRSDFERGTGHHLTRISRLLGAELARREEDRVAQVLDRIKDQVAAELRPRDLAYQILEGLLQLLSYDHSGTVILYDHDSSTLRIEAEKVVWTRGKSPFIGHQIPVPATVLAALAQGPPIHLFPRDLAAADGDLAELYGRLLGYHKGHGIPDATSTLVASLTLDGELLGLLKLASYERPRFDVFDRDVVGRFLPPVRYSLRNVRLRKSLEAQALQAEERAGLVTVARAVAHDVNNAVGTILLRAEQALEESEQGTLDAKALQEDLAEVVDRASFCKRIFTNMLQVSPSQTGIGPVDLNRVVREVRPLLEAQAAPRSVTLGMDLREPLAPVRSSRSHLQSLLVNLVGNAIDAFAGEAGNVRIRTAEARSDGALLLVRDDGPGMGPDLVARAQEPFFTTKRSTGLGIPLCRSLAAQCGGNLKIRSQPGQGTEVEVYLPFDRQVAEALEEG